VVWLLDAGTASYCIVCVCGCGARDVGVVRKGEIWMWMWLMRGGTVGVLELNTG
jgi:hypothetical protein